MSDFTFEILDSIDATVSEEKDPILCPRCNGNSLCKIASCFARCQKCGAVIIAEHIQMPESYKLPGKVFSRIKECYGKNAYTETD